MDCHFLLSHLYCLRFCFPKGKNSKEKLLAAVVILFLIFFNIGIALIQSFYQFLTAVLRCSWWTQAAKVSSLTYRYCQVQEKLKFSLQRNAFSNLFIIST